MTGGPRLSRLEKTARVLAAAPLCLLGLLALLALHFAVCSAIPALGRAGFLQAAGIFSAVVFLLLCVPAPISGVACGIASLCLFKGRRAKTAWKVLAVLDIVLGGLAAWPCLLLFLAATSGQI